MKAAKQPMTKTTLPEGEVFHVHAMTAVGPTLYAATSAWRAGLQRSDDGGTSWRVVHDHPTPAGEVSRITTLAVLDRVLYAGLTSFAHLEPEVVKIDMSIVREVDQSPTKQKLIRSITSLCKDMGMLVVGEGVETDGERNILIELGCDLVQGHLFAKPAEPFPDFVW